MIEFLGPFAVPVLSALSAAGGALLVWWQTRHAHAAADALQRQTIDLLTTQNKTLGQLRQEAVVELARERETNRVQADRHQTEISGLRTKVAVLEDQWTQRAAVAELTLFVAQQTAARATEHAGLLAAIRALHEDILRPPRQRRGVVIA